MMSYLQGVLVRGRVFRMVVVGGHVDLGGGVVDRGTDRGLRRRGVIIHIHIYF